MDLSTFYAVVSARRSTFAAVRLVRAWPTGRLALAERGAQAPRADRVRPPGRWTRWLATVLYVPVVIVAAVPEVAAAASLTDLQVAALAVCGLVVVAHTLAWQLLTATPRSDADGRA